MSNMLRITGMATGMDTDNMVKQMMQPYQMKLDSLKQTRQITEWKQNIYRDIIGSINTFKSTYFDVLKKDTYMLSSTNFSTFEAKTTDTTNSVLMTPGATAISGQYSVDVKNIAQKAIQTATQCKNVEQIGSPISFPVVIDSSNNKLTVDGKEITIDSKTYTNLSQLAININSKLSKTNDGTDLSKSVKAIVSADGKSVELKHLVNIDSTNNSLTMTTAGGKNINVTLAQGYYSLDEIVSTLNSNMSSLKTTDGSPIPAGFAAKVSADGLKIEYTDGGNDNRNYHVDNKAAVSSTGVGAGSTLVSNPTVNDDVLTYDKRIISGLNDTLTLNINGVRTDIKLTVKDYTNDASLYNSIAADINNQLNNVDVPGSVGSKMYTSSTDYKLKAYIDTEGKLSFESTTNFQVSMSGSATSTLGMPAAFSVNQNASDKMSTLVGGEVKFTINGQVFHYNFNTDTTDNSNPNDIIVGAKSKSIKDIISDISGKANVDITYSELTRKFSIQSKSTGYDQILNASDNEISTGNYGGKFLESLFGTGTISNVRGEDAEVIVTNPRNEVNTMHYSTNTFTLDDVSYTLNKETSAPITYNVNTNTDNSLSKIKDFISKYNELISKISDKVNESRPKSGRYNSYYLPLTDDQKKAMSESDIKAWEDKAKQGLVKGDSNLNNMLSSLRRAFFDTVKNSGTSLTEIGLSTSADVSEGGKIIIADEEKLKNALANNPDKVRDLFTKSSDISYSPDHTDYKERYENVGIFQRINDILQDNVRTVRDSGNRKGILIEKAGLVGDYSEVNNEIYKQLKDQDKRISDLADSLADREDRYYNQFAKLEAAMNQLNSQSSWLAQQLGMSSGK